MDRQEFIDLMREEVMKLPDLLSARLTEQSNPAVVHAIMKQGITQAYRRAMRRVRLARTGAVWMD